jgi:hypothetical protein
MKYLARAALICAIRKRQAYISCVIFGGSVEHIQHSRFRVYAQQA